MIILGALLLVAAQSPDSLAGPRILAVGAPIALGGEAQVHGQYLGSVEAAALLLAGESGEVAAPLVAVSPTRVAFVVPFVPALERGGPVRVVVRTARGTDTSATPLLITRTPKLTSIDAGPWRAPAPSPAGIDPPLPPRTARLIELQGTNLDRVLAAAIGDLLLPETSVVGASPFRVFIAVPDQCEAHGRLTLFFDQQRKQPALARQPLIGPLVTCGPGSRLSSP